MGSLNIFNDFMVEYGGISQVLQSWNWNFKGSAGICLLEFWIDFRTNFYSDVAGVTKQRSTIENTTQQLPWEMNSLF